MEQDTAATVEFHKLILWRFVEAESINGSKLAGNQNLTPNPFYRL
jgi:hypothetical protein